MRRVGRDTEQLLAWMALCALQACGGAVRSHEPQRAAVESCELRQVATRAADSADISFRAAGLAPSDCALRIAAASLRPWDSVSHEPWTVAVEHFSEAFDTLPATALVRRLHGTQGRDALDALDTGPILIATEDVELVAYADVRDDVAVVPLPWDRTYLRVGARLPESLGAVDPATVRVDARAAVALPDCALPALPDERRLAAPGPSGRVIYPAGDRTARELAERIVGVEGASKAVGLPPAELDAALHAGGDFAYIMLLLRASDWCRELIALTQRAPWIGSASVAPLVDTRAYTITRRAREP